jgi:hypothetical protein
MRWRGDVADKGIEGMGVEDRGLGRGTGFIREMLREMLGALGVGGGVAEATAGRDDGQGSWGDKMTRLNRGRTAEPGVAQRRINLLGDGEGRK